MASSIDTKFDVRLGRQADGILGLAHQTSAFVISAVANIGLATAKKAKDLTPRSPGSGPHIGDGWTAEATTVPGGISVRVYNADPRATAKLVLADGRRTSYTLLDILEHGSSPHLISPVHGPYLVFLWRKAGKVVRARSVHHPGTRPYAMIALSKVRADIELKKTFDAVQKTLRYILAGRPAGGIQTP